MAMSRCKRILRLPYQRRLAPPPVRAGAPSRWSSSNGSRLLSSASGVEQPLRIGVVGLGAVGTIFFAKLGDLAARTRPDQAPLVASVDAFVRPRQLSDWLATAKANGKKPSVSLIASDGQETLTPSKPQVDLGFDPDADSRSSSVTTTHAPNVRLTTLDSLEPSDEPIDVVLLAVKAYDSVATITELQAQYGHLFRPDALCVLLQNGLGELPTRPLLSASGPQWQFANGVTFIGGRVASFGDVVTSGVDAGMSYFAPVRDRSSSEQVSEHQIERIQALVLALQAAGLRSETLLPETMQTILWRKLIVNAAINPVASLLDAPNKIIGSSEWSGRIVATVVREAVAVACSEEVELDHDEEEIIQEVLEVAASTGSNVCSMLADLRRGSRTEIEAITGRIVALGARHGVPTPANELLLALVKTLEANPRASG